MSAPDASRSGGWAAWWAVFVIFLLSIVAVLDRQVINLMVGPIRASLQISDFQMSLLQGLSFATFYALFALPLGWIVDRGNQRTVIFGGITVWAACASLCGLATKYIHLLLARIGVGAGEAALAPASYSLLSELFPKEKLALPLAVMGTGAQLGNALAFMGGGLLMAALPSVGVSSPWFGHLEPWQAALLITGLPGLLLAPLILTVRVPARADDAQRRSGLAAVQAAGAVFLGEKRFYLCHSIGCGCAALCGYALVAWTPTFLMRVHDWSVGDAALATGALSLCCSAPGALVLGAAADRWYARGRTDAHLQLLWVTLIIQAAAVVAAFSMNSAWVTLLFIGLQQSMSAFVGVAAAALQISTPAHVRGQISAIFLLVFNLIGMGLGPSVVAGCTDFLFGDDMRVGSSIALTFAVVAPLGALLLYMAAKPMRRLAQRA